MRILINAMQRSSSKNLSNNLKFYLTKKFGCVNVPVLENWFEFGQNRIGNTNHYHMTVEDYQVKYEPLTTSYSEEVAHRLNFLLSYENPIIIKLHPDNSDCQLASQTLSSKYMCYNLSKKDIIEQTFSWLITNLTRQYVPGSAQKYEILKLSENPITISGNEFKKTLFFINQQNKKIQTLYNKKHLHYENLISITNAKEFCDYLDLPFVDFELHTNQGLEYGESKKFMIANYNDLHKFGGYLINKYNLDY